ncbi:MAG: hypothetical protein XFASWVDF_002357 [Candidatus Fervidibacter sp.]
MPNDDWANIEALEGLIVKAVREGMGDSQVDDETFRDLLMEGKIAAYWALQHYEPSKGEKTTWVFQSVVRHIRRVLQNYLPAGEPLPEEADDEGLGLVSPSAPSSYLSPLAVAVLLAAAPPLERLCVLHELLVWDAPPRYAKARLKKRWQGQEWVRLVAGNARKGWERRQLLEQLCLMAQEGEGREKELAGFALAALPLDELTEEEIALIRLPAQTLARSTNPLCQFAGLWALFRLQPQAWENFWVDGLDINALGAVLKARYAKPTECACPSPLCLHYHPDVLRHRPPTQVVEAVIESLARYADRIAHEAGQGVRWRGWWMARALGLYLQFSPDELLHLLPAKGRIMAMMATVAFAHFDVQRGLEQALEWLPKAPTVRERLLRALKSPEPIERSSALYAARALPAEDGLSLALLGLSDPSVLVRFAARRLLEEGKAWEPLYRELMHPHEHKRLLHRAILNILARLDLERTLKVASEIYRGRGKEAWREDLWLRHDAGYILLAGIQQLGRSDLLEVFRTVLEREPHPSPLVLLPAVQAFLSG